MLRNPKTSSRQRRGIATVEFAVVIPIFLLFIMGMLELGRLTMVKEMLSDAARKGCRTGIQRDMGTADIIRDCKDVMENDNRIAVDATQVVVTVTDPSGLTLGDALGAPSGSRITTQVRIQAKNVSWVSFERFYPRDTYESEIMVMMKQ